MIEIPTIGRETVGLKDNAFNGLNATFQLLACAANLSRDEKRSLSPTKFAGRIALLTTGHMRHFIEQNRMSPCQEEMDDLQKYIEHTLPSRLLEPIRVMALPSVVHTVGTKKRQLILGYYAGLETERWAVKRLIESYFEVPQSTDNWPVVSFGNGVELAQTAHENSDRIIDVAQIAAEQTQQFHHRHITYRPAATNMVSVNN